MHLPWRLGSERMASLSWGAALLMALVLSACAPYQVVKPWEKGELAGTDMRWDATPVETLLHEHTYSSKEATRGAAAVGGGGCGCN